MWRERLAMMGAGATISGLGALALTRLVMKEMEEHEPFPSHSSVVERDGHTVPYSKKSFLEKLEHDGKVAIRASELAKRRGVHERVRELGEYLVAEHEKSSYEIHLLAERMGYHLGTPMPHTASDAAVMASQKADEEKLKHLHGLAFDHAFASIMLGEHDHSIGTLKLGADVHAGNDVGSLCKEELASMLVHRQKILELCEELAPALEVPSMGHSRPPIISS